MLIVAANIRLMTLFVVGLPFVSFTGSAAFAGACDRTTASAAAACKVNAEGSYLLGLGVCENFSDAEQKEKCINKARNVRAAGRDDCDAQDKARANLCNALGQAPYDPVIRPSDFVPAITNRYFPLTPGSTFTYRGGDALVTVVVTRQTKKILGVTCVVVRDTKTINGKIEEDTLDYFAQDRHGNVWYFGETTAEYKNGSPVSTSGSWIAGKDGAKPGIIMPASAKVGATHRQEFALGEAEDASRIQKRDASVSVPYGTFSNAIKTYDFTPLEPEVRENKYYVSGVGLVLSVDLVTGEREELISIETE